MNGRGWLVSITRQAALSSVSTVRTKLARTSAPPGLSAEELRLIISHTSRNQSPMTILLWWLVFLTSVRPQAEVHLPRQNKPTAEIKTLKSLHSAAAPLIKCAECRVQFAKLQVFCTCKYSLITAIKEDYGRLADGECNVVLIRVWMHCNTNRMLTPSEQNGLLGPDKLYPDAAFSKLIITCSYNVCVTDRKRGWE